jgi:hypothetical protein
MEFFLHEKDLWDITSRKLLPLEVEFRDIFFEGNILKHCLFMKKNKLAHGTILLNVIDSLLHHNKCKNYKICIRICATFERKHVGNKL